MTTSRGRKPDRGPVGDLPEDTEHRASPYRIGADVVDAARCVQRRRDRRCPRPRDGPGAPSLPRLAEPDRSAGAGSREKPPGRPGRHRRRCRSAGRRPRGRRREGDRVGLGDGRGLEGPGDRERTGLGDPVLAAVGVEERHGLLDQRAGPRRPRRPRPPRAIPRAQPVVDPPGPAPQAGDSDRDVGREVADGVEAPQDLGEPVDVEEMHAGRLDTEPRATRALSAPLARPVTWWPSSSRARTATLTEYPRGSRDEDLHAPPLQRCYGPYQHLRLGVIKLRRRPAVGSTGVIRRQAVDSRARAYRMMRPMAHPRAGQPASPEDLIDVDAVRRRLLRPAHPTRPTRTSGSCSAPRVTAGPASTARSTTPTSPRPPRRSASTARARATRGPLFLGKDTHALSGPAWETAVEVLVANGVDVRVDSGGASPRLRPSRTPILTANAAADPRPTASWSRHRTTRRATAASSTTRRTADPPTPTPRASSPRAPTSCSETRPRRRAASQARVRRPAPSRRTTS